MVAADVDVEVTVDSTGSERVTEGGREVGLVGWLVDGWVDG